MPRNFYPKGGDMDDDGESMGRPDHEDMHEDGHDEEGMDHEKMDEETAMLPKSLLAGKEFNPGDELVLKIVKMHGDEVEVAYAKEKGDEEEEEPEAMAREHRARPEMDSMMGKIGAMGGM